MPFSFCVLPSRWLARPASTWLGCSALWGAAVVAGWGTAAHAAKPASAPAVVQVATSALPSTATLQRLQAAEAIWALPDGWLTMEPHALVLRDAQGRERDRLAVRGGALTAHSDAQGTQAWVLDSNTQQPIAVQIDLQSGKLHAQKPLMAARFAVNAMCAWRDAQGLDFLFLLGKDGHAEQWLLHAGQAQNYRRIVVPPGASSCQVDAGSGTLLVAEETMGAWAYAVAEEGLPRREPVLLRQPFGQLKKGAGAVASVPGGAAVLAADGKSIHLMRAAGTAWKSERVLALPAKADPELLSVRSHGQGLTLLWREDKGGSWHALQHAWKLGHLPSQAAQPALPVVKASAQTDSVAMAGDAADDPAIWIDPVQPARSLLLGTNKKQGLLVYDLQGKERQMLESGRLNNVDVRQQVRFGAEQFDLAVATQRDDLSLVLFTIAADGKVSEAARVPTGLKGIYGLCMYQPPQGGLEVFVNDKDGQVQHQRISRVDNQWRGEVVRTLRLPSQPEGCVVDDANGRLFIGEEDVGVWTTSASASRVTPWESVMKVGAQLHADVEGMAIYYGQTDGKPNGRNYLLVSSQGNNSYVVLDAQAPYAYRGAFRLGINAAAGIDGTADTDGLDVTSANLGGAYGDGLLVVQDGFKRLPDGPQNFKLVPWSEVKAVLNLP